MTRATFLMIAMLAATTPIVDVAEDDNACGEPRHVAAFTVDHGGSRYTLPAYVTIQKAGVTLFEDESTHAWRPPYNGVESSSFNDYLLLQTFEKDCVDLYLARLFMVSPDGSVIHQPVWTSNWRDGFFVANDKLTYWSEWFCHPSNPEREEEASYVYVFSESKKTFVRQVVDASAYCDRSSELEFLRFAPAKATP